MKTNGTNINGARSKRIRALLALVESMLPMLRAEVGSSPRATSKGLGWDDLNPRERRALRFIASKSGDVAMVDLASKFVGDARSKKQARSWARNSVRRPTREGMLVRVSDGVYRATRKGRAEVA